MIKFGLSKGEPFTDLPINYYVDKTTSRLKKEQSYATTLPLCLYRLF